MPLSKKRNRDRMRQQRQGIVQPTCNPTLVKPVQPRRIPGLIMEGNRILVAEPSKWVSRGPQFDSRVLSELVLESVKKDIIQPKAYISDFEIDADGNIIPSYT